MQKILITCEHGGNQIPKEFAGYFAEHPALLRSHRGWDIGALELYRNFIKAGADAFFYSETSRLMVELNRSKNHPNFFSAITKTFSRESKKNVIEKYYEPYRSTVENQIATFLNDKHAVLHLSVHSFTPELNNEIRNADIGLLYDPKRKCEKTFSLDWKEILNEENPQLKVRFNYPYRGTADGFTTYLRKKFPEETYAGIELEVNQKFPLGVKNEWLNLQQAIVQSFYKASAKQVTIK